MSTTPPSEDDASKNADTSEAVTPLPLVEPAEPIDNRTPSSGVSSDGVNANDIVVVEPQVPEEQVVEQHPAEAQQPEQQLPIASADEPVRTVYVTAPTEPTYKGNRGFGVLFAVLGTIIFAALYSAAIALLMVFVRPGHAFGGSFTGFLSSSAFWVPVISFLVVFILMTAIVNRAGWVAWVFASFVVAVLVYLLSLGGILLVEGAIGLTPDEAAIAFGRLALSAPMIIAAILTREVTIWLGAAIASRGRKVKASNVDARAQYERELADNRARYSGV